VEPECDHLVFNHLAVSEEERNTWTGGVTEFRLATAAGEVGMVWCWACDAEARDPAVLADR